MDHTEINQVVDAVYNSLKDDNQTPISGKSNNQNKASGRTHLKDVLVDLLVAWKPDQLLCIGNDAYKVNSGYMTLCIHPIEYVKLLMRYQVKASYS